MPDLRVAMLGNFPMDPDRIPGGVAAVIKNLVCALAQMEGMEVHLLTCVPGLRQPQKNDFAAAVIHYIPGQTHLGVITTGHRDRKRLSKEVQSVAPHIVHAHGSGHYALAALDTPYPAIMTLHGMKSTENRLRTGVKDRVREVAELRAERMVLARAKHIITIADYVRATVEPHTSARLYPIRNPVSGRLFELKTSDSAETVLSVAAIQRRKGLHHLIEAFAQVRRECPRARLHLIGKVLDADYNSQLQNMVNDLGLTSSVHFAGLVPDDELLREITTCSILALCSFEETSPVSIAEAMTLSKPVVATRVGGVPDLVNDGVTGYLLDYGDTPAITEALRHLLRDSQLRTRMGKAAREWAETHFHPVPIARRTVTVYRDIIAAEGDLK